MSFIMTTFSGRRFGDVFGSSVWKKKGGEMAMESSRWWLTFVDKEDFQFGERGKAEGQGMTNSAF